MSLLKPLKPFSVDDFQNERKHLTKFVDNNIKPCLKNPNIGVISIQAPVKSGKREISEYISMSDYKPNNNGVYHIFASAFHRTADDNQREELKQHKLDVHCIIDKKI